MAAITIIENICVVLCINAINLFTSSLFYELPNIEMCLDIPNMKFHINMFKVDLKINYS